MVDTKNFYFSTDIYTTPSGMKVRIDIVPCTHKCLDGTPCGVKKKYYFEVCGLDKKKYRIATWICRHVREQQNLHFWDHYPLLDLLDEIHLESQNSGTHSEKWKRIQKKLAQKYPDIPFKDFPKLETRPGKGKYKEWRNTCSSKFENLAKGSPGQKAYTFTEDVFSDTVKRSEANDSVISVQALAVRNTRQPSRSVTYDDSNCSCGHEMVAHDHRQYCSVCKEFCDA